MIRLTRVLDTIFRMGAPKTPAQIEAEKWLEDHSDDFETWHPRPSDYTYGDFPDAYSEGEPNPMHRAVNNMVSGLNVNWPESVGHPADFHPAFLRAGFRLNVPRTGDTPSYSMSTEPPMEGALSGSHRIWPSYDSTTPWAGLNTYGPWSGGVGHYATPEDAIQGARDDEQRYLQHHRNYVADRDRHFG